MDRERALRTLGLEKGARADDINRAYRALIRQAHPDAGGSTAVAARITEAYHWLQRAGTQSPPPPRPPQPDQPSPVTTDDSMTLLLPPGDVFIRLVEAGHQLGEVSYVDRDAGIVQVTFTADNGVVCQLAATVVTGGSATSRGDARVEFTLDPLASGLAPPIESVVNRLARMMVSSG
ncbi:MAG: J domain-containing protein [Acidimicrobiia bacterium]|nr:J domain-containing protein [Acidimicrobiia bacterium]MYB08535.1 J domain-containing protein [Acidimicrobiia bacterium]MYB75427.1 J domain-containing protein [Acidimicrobiia bacterium]MYG59259.1 J domain-containing protein [Acidimicrobiia bacterium]MYH98865.1 J domain-containing protein [Acidimicrobiia bacterium]